VPAIVKSEARLGFLVKKHRLDQESNLAVDTDLDILESGVVIKL
jgi:hypothetical protein